MAQSKVYQLFADKLFGVCLKYSKNHEDAEDTLQDSFLTIFDKISMYKNVGSFEGWMKRIAINTALQKYRNSSSQKIISEEYIKEDDDVIDLSEDVSIDFLLSLIQQLPDRYRLVFNLYVLDSFSHKEIADLLQISVGTSKSNLSRARHLLKTKLKAHQHVQNKA